VSPRWRALGLAMVCAAASLAVAVPVDGQVASRAVRFGRIVFQSNRGGHPEIYIMNVDGSGQTRLTNFDNEKGNREPSITRDGRKIAFYSNRSGHAEIYTMDADGSNERLIAARGIDSSPAFSYDGTRIVFVKASFVDGLAVSNIWVMNDTGGDQKELTHRTPAMGSVGQPQFSPDGKKIVFVGQKGSSTEIYVMDADGSHVQQLTETHSTGVQHDDPMFSPNGEKIIFESSRENNGKRGIFTMNASDGNNVVKISHDGFSDSAPAFSTTGSQIVFVSRRNGAAELFSMNRDGSDETQLTHREDGKADVFPSWGG
jgi:Tol biopolymer transport system component